MEIERLKKAIADINKITNFKKLRSFQYRLLCKAIITNMHLMHYKIRLDNRCTFCDIEKQTLSHLFLRCQVVKKFLSEICQWQNIPISSLSFEAITLNTITGNIREVQNTIILLAKQYIYKSRCKNEKPNFIQFKSEVIEIKTIEYEIAKKSDKLNKHERKWKYVKS